MSLLERVFPNTHLTPPPASVTAGPTAHLWTCTVVLLISFSPAWGGKGPAGPGTYRVSADEPTQSVPGSGENGYFLLHPVAQL